MWSFCEIKNIIKILSKNIVKIIRKINRGLLKNLLMNGEIKVLHITLIITSFFGLSNARVYK